MKKISKQKSPHWTPLKLEGSVLSGNFEGLIGIEELTDYTLDESNRKRYVVNQYEDSDNDEPNVKKRKKEKQPNKSKKKEKRKKNGLKVKEKNVSQIKNNTNNIDEECQRDQKHDINIDAWTSLGVPPVIVKALADQKFESPTLIQSMTLAPAILGRRDILGAAETGSGKTLAFGIPIINGILQLKQKEKENLSFGEEKEYGEVNGGSDDNDVINDECQTNDTIKISAKGKKTINNTGCVQVLDKVRFINQEIKTTKPLYALILTPTRELAIQIKNHISRAAKYTDLKIAVVVGGMAAVKQERILSKGPEIVIATPGRLWELLNEGNLHLSQLDSIKFLAIDETDRMLEQGHFQELHMILEKINAHECKIQERQNFVFSATLTLVHDIPQYLQRKKLRNARSKIHKLTSEQKLQKVINMLKVKHPKIVDITKEKGTAGSLTECRIACTIDHKDYYLYYFLKRHTGRTLVFCNSIGCVKRLSTLFSILDCKPLPLHANMMQRQRLKNLERFQEDDNGLLVATDVAARGLDIPNVEHVIHYQVPRTSESYVHRSGRTGRAQKEGITVLMMEPSEKQFYTRLCKTLGRSHDLPTFPVIDRLLIAVKERVNIAREIDKLELLSRRDNVQKDWLRKAVENMDLIIDDDDRRTTNEVEETAYLKRNLKAKRRQLSNLLTKPLFPKGFSGKYLDFNMTLSLNENSQRAIDVMKQVIEECPRKKEKRPSLIVIKKSHLALKKKLKSERRVKLKREKKSREKAINE